jgi:D-alanine--poly(phosphoribitol) ligase subunit 2
MYNRDAVFTDPRRNWILRQDILIMIYAAIDEVEPRSLGGGLINKSPDAGLLGSEQGVDSLTLVNLVVAVEEQVHRTTGKSIVLVDEDNLALHEHPFRTIGTLAAYLENVLSKQ